MNETLRKPAVFSVDDPRLVVAEPDERRAAERRIGSADPRDLPAVPAAAPRRRIRWGALFWSALSGLVLIALGLAVTTLVEDLFARAPWLGAIGLRSRCWPGLRCWPWCSRELVGLAAARHGRGAARTRRGGHRKRRPRAGPRAVADMLR